MKAESTSGSRTPDSGDGQARHAIRVAVVDDCELVATGVAGMFAAFPEQVELVDLNGRPIPHMAVDLILYDPFAQPLPGTQQLIGWITGLASRTPRPKRCPVMEPHRVTNLAPFADEFGRRGRAEVAHIGDHGALMSTTTPTALDTATSRFPAD